MSNQKRIRIAKGNKISNDLARKRATLQTLKRRKAKIQAELAAVHAEIDAELDKILNDEETKS